MIKMENKYFAWDDVSDGLILLSAQRAETKEVQKITTKFGAVHDSNVYCPHAYLILNFNETLSEREKLKFRRYYLRKTLPNQPDVIILQDIKDLVIFLLISPVSPQFIKFFHMPIVDRFLRALIIYFQYYVITWEELIAEYAATIKKAPNPLARGYRSSYAEEMQNLRCVLGREYADLIVGCQDNIQYHHMTGGKRGSSFLVQSEGEKDLRIFETLICIAHRVVWIALQRKHFNLIEIELHRLFRTKSYNMAERQSSNQSMQKMLMEDIEILQGRKLQVKRKLLRNSPLIQELIYSNCDYRLLALGDNTDDDRILYLQNALLIEEEKLHELGIKIGILGDNRANYNIMLMPVEEIEVDKMQLSERRKYEGESIKDTSQSEILITTQRLPPFQTKYKLSPDFPLKEINISPRGYKTIRVEARKKWFKREIKRRKLKQMDTLSIGTMLD
ncbi:protein phosphatase 1 regulatory subunit 36 [Megachile rotundata]|uniref:protein phosphatase 1 regulatory subunit 36 n=1 Tax=Megachile rotundata TaxID=143995 RepID=UPI003FD43E42